MDLLGCIIQDRATAEKSPDTDGHIDVDIVMRRRIRFMNPIDAIQNRTSARAFLDQPINRETVETILKDASRAPSAINMQPWEIHVVAGEELKRLSRRLMKAYGERRLTCGPGAASRIPDKFIERAKQTADDMTPFVERMNNEFKTFVNEGSLHFYHAPAAIFLFIDECFLPDRLVDIGVFLGYLLLSISGRGLGSCPIGLVKSYEEEIKDSLNIPESKTLVVSVAVGEPDPTAAVNEFRSSRIDVGQFVRWID